MDALKWWTMDGEGWLWLWSRNLVVRSLGLLLTFDGVLWISKAPEPYPRKPTKKTGL